MTSFSFVWEIVHNEDIAFSFVGIFMILASYHKISDVRIHLRNEKVLELSALDSEGHIWLFDQPRAFTFDLIYLKWTHDMKASYIPPIPTKNTSSQNLLLNILIVEKFLSITGLHLLEVELQLLSLKLFNCEK